MFAIATSSIAQGLLWAVMATGVYVTYRILDIPDLSAEGTFPLGAAVAASLMTAGVPALVATVLAILAGLAAGALAGFLHAKMKIPGLLTGILMLTGLYSINLRVLGRANLTLLGVSTLMRQMEGLVGSRNLAGALVGLLWLAVVGAGLVWFFTTEIGLALRATGNNETMALANAIPVESMKILGYMLSNGLVALAGALIAQQNGYADIGMGIGTIVIGLASIIVGEVLLKPRRLPVVLVAIALGSILYRFVVDIVLTLGVAPQDIKLFSAILLAIILWLPQRVDRLKERIVT